MNDMKTEKSAALLLYAASDIDANIYYATRFFVPDPFIFIQVGKKKIVAMSDLEVGRAREQAKVDQVITLTAIQNDLKQRGVKPITMSDIIKEILVREGASEVCVPSNFPLGLADELRERGLTVRAKKEPYFESRVIKTAEEIKHLEETQNHTEVAVEKAIRVLRESTIKGDQLIHNGSPLTAEKIKTVIQISLIENGCACPFSIVSCGDQACDPHNTGSGPLRPNVPIILDIFPRSYRTNYCADMTRTVVKGRASEAVKKLYAAVLKAQERGIEVIREGVDGKWVHDEVAKVLTDAGYKTGERNGKMEGFFHGTGHGIGLDVHEEPRVGRVGNLLPAGSVVTVEPGLYYFGVGGVRLEDMVLVEKNGCRNLTKMPKFLELD